MARALTLLIAIAIGTAFGLLVRSPPTLAAMAVGQWPLAQVATLDAPGRHEFVYTFRRLPVEAPTVLTSCACASVTVDRSGSGGVVRIIAETTPQVDLRAGTATLGWSDGSSTNLGFELRTSRTARLTVSPTTIRYRVLRAVDGRVAISFVADYHGTPRPDAPELIVVTDPATALCRSTCWTGRSWTQTGCTADCRSISVGFFSTGWTHLS